MLYCTYAYSIAKQNGVPETILAMISTIAHILLEDDFLSVFWYYELVFPDKRQTMRLQKLEQSTNQEDKIELRATLDLQKSAYKAFQLALFELIGWKTHVDFKQYIEHVNKLAPDAPELKKMLTDRYLSQEEEYEREATGIGQFEESFPSQFRYDPEQQDKKRKR